MPENTDTQEEAPKRVKFPQSRPLQFGRWWEIDEEKEALEAMAKVDTSLYTERWRLQILTFPK